MNQDLVLTGSAEELKSFRAFKIVAASAHAGLPLMRKVSTGDVELVPNSMTPPMKNVTDLMLIYDKKTRIASIKASLRLLGGLASPALHFLGETPIEQANVDGWMSFALVDLETTLQVLTVADAVSEGESAAKVKGAKQDLQSTLAKLDQHLLYQTYLVGHSLTVADIDALISVHMAVVTGHWDPPKFTDGGEETTSTPGLMNLGRWYRTLTHQEWFTQAAEAMTSATAPVASATFKVESATGGSDGPVQYSGTPTPVHNVMYRRRRIRIKEVLQSGGSKYLEQSITVAGWARTIRKASSKLFFVELNDGSTGASLQCVLDIQTTEGFDECKQSGGTGASFQFFGVIVPSEGEGQVVDMKVTGAKLLGAVYGGNVQGTEVGGMLYPMSKKEHTLEHFREHAHLRARASIHAAAMRVRHAMAFATHNFFNSHGFLYIHTPIITGADCEGAGEQFGVTTMLGTDHLKPGVVVPVHEPQEQKTLSKSEQKRLAKKKGKEDPSKPPPEQIVEGAVDYSKDFYGQRVNLTVSGQLNVETHACALSDVYTFGPTFRAEESRTYRHLSEFWMIEPEMAFCDLTDDLNLAEDYLKYCVRFALENCADDLQFFENNKYGEAGLRDRLRNVLDNKFKRLTYTEAIEILQKAVENGVQFEIKPEWGIDLPSEHERYICEQVFKQPVILTDYPKEIKAFYMKLNDDKKTVAAADVLVPKIGEIIGGSQREHRLDVLRERCVEMHLDPRSVWWYLDLRRYGTVPHAGFGLGFERLILFVTGLDNIRDVIPFPRWVGNANF